MKIQTIELYNWLPFKGSQKIEFPQDESSNVIIFYGENMHGKTSLINAFRWCLYGKAFDGGNKLIENENLLNNLAKKENNKIFKVEMNFTADGNSYQLLRKLDQSNNSENLSVVMRKNGRVIEGNKVSREIDYIMPEQISQFFLFDGELLNEFEQLVKEEGAFQSNKIKKNIEKALGIPIFTRGIDELSNVHKVFEKKLSVELSKNKEIEKKVGLLDLKRTELSFKEKEITDIETLISDNDRNIYDLETKINSISNDIKLIERKTNLNEEKKSNNKLINEKKQKIKGLNNQLWKIPLNYIVKNIRDKLQKEYDDISNKDKENIIVEYEITRLKEILDKDCCSICNNKINNDQKIKIKNEFSVLNDKKDKFENHQKIKETISLKLSMINLKNYDDPSQTLKTLEDDIINLVNRNIEIENSLYDIDKELENSDSENNSLIKTKYDNSLKEQGRLLEELKNSQLESSQLKFTVKDLENDQQLKLFSKMENVSPIVEFSKNLHAIFRNASANYRDSMKDSIQERANKTFAKLTTEKEFDTLKINETYGLSLIINDQIVNKSRGAEQIVALSLIEALNQLGRRKGPMIMDTPMGRLDLKHRKNILKYLPEVTTQLSLFVHSGEIKKENLKDLLDISKLGKSYVINRLSTFHSVLEEA